MVAPTEHVPTAANGCPCERCRSLDDCPPLYWSPRTRILYTQLDDAANPWWALYQLADGYHQVYAEPATMDAQTLAELVAVRL